MTKKNIKKLKGVNIRKEKGLGSKKIIWITKKPTLTKRVNHKLVKNENAYDFFESLFIITHIYNQFPTRFQSFLLQFFLGVFGYAHPLFFLLQSRFPPKLRLKFLLLRILCLFVLPTDIEYQILFLANAVFGPSV